MKFSRKIINFFGIFLVFITPLIIHWKWLKGGIMGIICLFIIKGLDFIYIWKESGRICAFFLLVTLSGFVNIWTKREKKTSTNQKWLLWGHSEFWRLCRLPLQVRAFRDPLDYQDLLQPPADTGAFQPQRAPLVFMGSNPPFPSNVVVICWLEGSSISVAFFRSVKVTHPKLTCLPCYHRLTRE